MAERGPPTVPIPETLPGARSAVAVTFKAPLVQQGHAAEIAGRDVVLPSRYALVGRIASGSFGEVWRVNDCVLDRVLAMKVQRSEHCHSQHLRARFLSEARITADLQHPGIVAVHDQGELADGRLWFTMKEVRGRTLRDVINEVHLASSTDGFHEAASGWTFRRLLDAFARICQAVAFAHSRGVMHRDLKPDNLMVGEFGEVLVMDWGLARRVGVKEESIDGSGDDELDFASEDRPASLTRMGDILGTPAYMPPEQARGQRELHGPHSDVYALGAILFHLLSGRIPYDGTSSLAVLRQVINGPPQPLTEVLVARPPVPAELVALCERAMQREIRDRYLDAEPLARELFAFLEGARRREQALAVLSEARALEPEIAGLRRRVALRREGAKALLAGVQPFDPIEKKRPGWELDDEAARLGREAALHETEWLQTVHGALILYPELPEAHALLADHYSERLSAAELAHHDEDAARYQALLRAHDRGRHTAFLRGEGALTLSTDPPGAVVRVERYALHDRRLVPVDEGALGTTPLRAVPIVRGSYRLRIQAPGRAEVVYPVLVERGSHWEGSAPGQREPHAITLPEEGELGPDDCYVPAGWCLIGGDSEAGDSLPPQRVWIDGFVMRRFPVTNQEYIDFLNDLVASGREADAIAACPKSATGMGDARATELALRRDPEGRFQLTPGEQEADAPVVAIDWHSAMAYAEWLSARTGKPWRLPNELEREKAARGVDGRFGPWGDHLDATFACTADSKSGELVVGRVIDYPLDESPYGVRGLAGNVRDWCANIWRREGPRIEDGRLSLAEDTADGNALRSVRGGAWMGPLNTSRSAFRFAARADLRRVSVGMRLVRSR